MLPSIINIVAVISIPGLLKNPIDSLWVEKPPVARVVNEWAILSKALMPCSQYTKAHTKVSEV